MAIQIASELIPSGGANYPLIDVSYTKGAFLPLVNESQRTSLSTAQVKVGQFVYITETKAFWRVSEVIAPSKDNPDAVDSVAWEQVNFGFSFVQDTAPNMPPNGAIWYNTISGKTYIRVQTSTQSVWMEI